MIDTSTGTRVGNTYTLIDTSATSTAFSPAGSYALITGTGTGTPIQTTVAVLFL